MHNPGWIAMKHYKAPWGTSLTVISVLVTLLCVGIAIFMLRLDGGALPWLAVLPLAIVAGSAPFAIRGYTIDADAIRIRRLFWENRLPRAGLESARFEPGATRRSLRICGNGGLFSFSGLFYKKGLGAYRAFVTDPGRTVVLRYASRRVVVSPDAPEQFVEELGVG